METYNGGSHYIDEDKLKEIVKLSNAQNPDIVVLLGDFVSLKSKVATKLENRYRMKMETIASNLAGLKSKHGVFAVFGNNDVYYDWGIVGDQLKRIGYKVLENEVAIIEKGRSEIACFRDAGCNENF